MKTWMVMCVMALIPIPSLARPAQVILLRHAEKPEPEGSHLSEEGYARARALGSYFQFHPDATRFGRIAAFYAVRPDRPDGSVRSIETLTPAAQALGLKVHSDFTKLEVRALASEVLDHPALDGRTVVICWEHKRIPEIARELGAKDVPKEWGGKIYDRIWYLEFHRGGRVEFRNLRQDEVEPLSPSQRALEV